MTEFSRARRAALQPQTTDSPKAEKFPRKEPILTDRIPFLSSPPIFNAGTVSHLSLLNKVDFDTPTTAEKNSTQRPSLEIKSDCAGSILKSSSLTTSQDITLKLNQTATKVTFSTPDPTIRQHDKEKAEKNDDLAFSITDVTD